MQCKRALRVKSSKVKCCKKMKMQVTKAKSPLINQLINRKLINRFSHFYAKIP